MIEPDITERLRLWSYWLDDRCPDTAVMSDLREAADQIERLRGELAEARQIIFRLQTFAACCRTSPAATTRDGEEPFISEAL